jgi:hypothetical protein
MRRLLKAESISGFVIIIPSYGSVCTSRKWNPVPVRPGGHVITAMNECMVKYHVKYID